ncbi:MAG: hypothetical protein EBW05_10170, partial [Betaproteobacteria bacterium]|nr:hypothetical protein [Betaproteobacteria bacterium]
PSVLVEHLAHVLQAEGVQHDLPAEVIAEATGDLQASEEARARALWERRFGVIADDPKERLRQMRFLAARGFSHELIRRITRSS